MSLRKIGYCPDCFKCGYFGHISRNHTELLATREQDLQGQVPPRAPNRDRCSVGKGTALAKAAAVIDGMWLKPSSVRATMYAASVDGSEDDTGDEMDLELLYNKVAFQYLSFPSTCMMIQPYPIREEFYAGSKPNGGMVDSGASKNLVNNLDNLENIQ